jgi:uncharacterized protein YeaO (DUF488 family)
MGKDIDISQYVPPVEPKCLQVYTSHYSYRGLRRFDITVKKGSDVFCPEWEMVMAYKNGNMSIKEYTSKYHKMMQDSYKENREVWNRLLQADYVVLVCFCKAGEFCHRLLLAEYLEKCGANYVGEIPPS